MGRIKNDLCDWWIPRKKTKCNTMKTASQQHKHCCCLLSFVVQTASMPVIVQRVCRGREHRNRDGRPGNVRHSRGGHFIGWQLKPPPSDLCTSHPERSKIKGHCTGSNQVMASSKKKRVPSFNLITLCLSPKI